MTRVHPHKEAHVIHLRRGFSVVGAVRSALKRRDAYLRPRDACAPPQREEYHRGGGVVEDTRPGTHERPSVRVNAFHEPVNSFIVTHSLAAIACTFTPVFTCGRSPATAEAEVPEQLHLRGRVEGRRGNGAPRRRNRFLKSPATSE
ncbi:uncharacterized protein LOC143179545 [Calliopsis andreniformis]|uniref:uncharacterized protein LOC143179545 n=1 Tax=Calliopsis andreniformis TaxID=337506 RepID=UPI003FCE6A5B